MANETNPQANHVALRDDEELDRKALKKLVYRRKNKSHLHVNRFNPWLLSKFLFEEAIKLGNPLDISPLLGTAQPARCLLLPIAPRGIRKRKWRKKIPPFGGTGFQLRVVIQATEK